MILSLLTNILSRHDMAQQWNRYPEEMEGDGLSEKFEDI